MDKKKVKASGVIEQYILGLTSREQDAIVEQLMVEDASIKKQILEAQDALCKEAQSYSKKAPANLKKKIFNNIEQSESLEYNNVSTGYGNLLKYAAVGILMISTIGLYLQNSTLRQENEVLGAEVVQLNQSISATAEANSTLVSNEYILTHSETDKVELRGTNLSPEASLTAFYNPAAEVLMIKIQKLPPPPEGKYYHMWADVDGEMKHVGKISTNEFSLTSLNFVAQAESLNITIEDEEEVDHATVEQLALSGAL